MTFHKITEERFEPSKIWYHMGVRRNSEWPLFLQGTLGFVKHGKGEVLLFIPSFSNAPRTFEESHREMNRVEYDYEIKKGKTIELNTKEGEEIFLTQRQQEELLKILTSDESVGCCGYEIR